jgi:phosphoenolpyruvate carboxykinase (ATP)
VTNDRILIGDDEHGWTQDGVFNFEGGCYAKVIRLSAEAEPEIFERTRSFGTVLENVVMDVGTRILDLDDESITENTRGSYPLSSLSNVSVTGCGKQPSCIFFLSADAFGVLPPISKLTINQAMYYFISGYTAKLAGTERGIIKPEATFSTCFGAPFMPRHASIYAELLGQRMLNNNVQAWLVNTGWSGGPYGIGERVKISHTRSMIRAVLLGSIETVLTYEDPIFGVEVPISCPDVPDSILRPRDTWPNPNDYDEQAKLLARMFQDNFASFADQVSLEVLNAGP